MFGGIADRVFSGEGLYAVTNDPLGSSLNTLLLAPPCIGRLSLQQVPGGNWTSKPDPDWQASWPLEAIWSLCSKLCWGKGLCKKVNRAFRSALPTHSGSVDQGLAQPMNGQRNIWRQPVRTPSGSSGVVRTQERFL